ncbi:MAG: hypothetical protein HQK83_07915 [Fibrobacteria bacterium]|nr:hypothetical protein [Fibrobacteria bacterium]
MIKHKIILAALLMCSVVLAQFPAQDMENKTLGTSISASLRGQDITSESVPSHENNVMWNFGYAPVPYVLLYGGVGFDKLTVDEFNNRKFTGNFGFSPLLGISAYTPMLANFLRLTAGVSGFYFNSQDNSDFKYSGFTFNPKLGAIFSIGDYVDLGAGGKLHWIEGTMRQGTDNNGAFFSNENLFRFYTNLMIKSVYERVFLNVDFDISPGMSKDWTRGPSEASIGVSIGVLLDWKERKDETKQDPLYFESYKELKKKQKKMQDDLE